MTRITKTVEDLLNATNPYSRLYLRGVEAPSSRRYLIVSMDGRTVNLTASEANCSPSELAKIVTERGIPLYGKDGAEALAKRLPFVSWTRQDVVEHPGRHRQYFGLVDGRVLKPDGVDEVDSVYRPQIDYHRSKGSSNKWRKTVGVQAIGHPHLQLASLLPLTAGLANMLGERCPLVIEYVCPPSSSRQDLVLAAASVTGSVAIAATPFISFAADPATMLERHKGTVLVLDDPALAFAAETTAKSQSILIDVVRSLASSGKGPAACLIVGTKALADWAGCHTETAALLQDQVITIVIDEESPFGIYQSAGDGGVAIASAKFQDAASNAHGALYRDFMQKVVQFCSDGKPALRAVIEKRTRAFLVWANSDPNDQIAAQQARVFGLIYATAWLAKKHQILPSDWQVTKVVARVFRSRLRKGIWAPPITLARSG